MDRALRGDWSDILAIQDRIAEAVAAALQRRIARDSLGARSANPAAYMAYRRGDYLVARHAMSRALEYFREASRLDPQYALPYHGVAVTHILTALVGAAPAETQMRFAQPLRSRWVGTNRRAVHFRSSVRSC
jgi:hypothetical protein